MFSWISAIGSFFSMVGKALGLIHDAQEKQAGIDAQKAADLSATVKEVTAGAQIDDANAGLTRQQLIDKLHVDGAGRQ